MQRKIERDDLIKQFLRSGRTGFYLWVLKEGDVGAGDRLEHRGGEKNSLSVLDTHRLYTREIQSVELLDRAVRTEALPAGWKERFRKQREALSG